MEASCAATVAGKRLRKATSETNSLATPISPRFHLKNHAWPANHAVEPLIFPSIGPIAMNIMTALRLIALLKRHFLDTIQPGTMTSEQFLKHLQKHAASFAKAVATNEGEWIIKGFIDVHQRIYSISVDTKIVSKVLELLLFPMFVEFAAKQELQIELCQHQNFYPDLTFTHTASGNRFAVDIKSTYRENETKVNGMTLGAFTGYFRNRDSNKNTLYPYSQYASHFVLGVIYTKCDDVADERRQFSLADLAKIPSVIKDFEFFAQPKFRIATARPGSGNTKNIGSADKIDTLINGTGPFASLGEEVYDDYWMFYLTRDMAEAVGLKRPYMNLKTYLEYKQRGTDTLKAHAKEIASLAEEEPENEETGS